jgi:molecular chaperone HtpG
LEKSSRIILKLNYFFNMQKGNISVQTENIFPIIKQFLYSDQEIFLRELISNAVDATTKLKTLVSKGEIKAEIGDTTIEILLDAEAKTLTIRDHGIGMSEEEVVKYLTQVAFSGASEFLEKYKGEANIIGHFGLGFYSAFMVAEKVEVVTKSWRENTAPVVWISEGTPEYLIGTAEKEACGTDIILHISEEASEYLEKSRIDTLLHKYCKFLPVPIKFGTRTEYLEEGEGDDAKETSIEIDNIINNPNPIWKKQPSELTDEDYLNFYQEMYPMASPSLFWIHLNIDYPFNLTGILYFPKLTNNLEVQKNKIQLYSNQVYVTDDVKEIVPEFLTLLHGVIDSPDIPLNVSRSYLQADKEVKKITGYITRKVADKLNELFKNSREEYEQKWKDIGTFVKYGMLSDEKFNERAEKSLLLQNIENQFFTLEEYNEKVKANQTDKNNRLVYLYSNNPTAHDAYIKAATNRGYDVLQMDTIIDNHFLQHLEQKHSGSTFVRVDSDTVNNLIPKDEKIESVLSDSEQASIKTVFESATGGKGVSINLTALSPEDQPVTITKPEFMRRMRDMQALQGMSFGDFPEFFNVVVNTNHSLVADKLLKLEGEAQQEFARYLYDLGKLSQGMLTGADLTAFVNRSLTLVK